MFLTEIKFDQNFFMFDILCWLNPKKDNFTLKFLVNLPGDHEHS